VFRRSRVANHLATLRRFGFWTLPVFRFFRTSHLRTSCHVAPRLRSAEVEDSAVKWHRQSCLCSYRF
jgi:hypothetical protein